MGEPQYLIDTNSIIDYLNSKLPDSGKLFLDNIVDDVPNLSIICKIEILGFNTTNDHYQVLVDFINDSFVLELSEEIVDRTISLRKQSKIKLPDAIVAATALVYDYILITRNIADFKNIEGLTLINPHNL